jgi:hypothetical protein
LSFDLSFYLCQYVSRELLEGGHAHYNAGINKLIKTYADERRYSNRFHLPCSRQPYQKLRLDTCSYVSEVETTRLTRLLDYLNLDQRSRTLIHVTYSVPLNRASVDEHIRHYDMNAATHSFMFVDGEFVPSTRELRSEEYWIDRDDAFSDWLRLVGMNEYEGKLRGQRITSMQLLRILYPCDLIKAGFPVAIAHYLCMAAGEDDRHACRLARVMADEMLIENAELREKTRSWQIGKRQRERELEEKRKRHDHFDEI